jgi:hypothetical protein
LRYAGCRWDGDGGGKTVAGSYSRNWDRQHRERRRRIDYPAWIDCGQGQPLRNCIIWDISETGGRITIAEAETLPDEFVLVLSRTGDFGRRCRVLWREGLQVEFFTIHSVQKKTPAASAGVAQYEVDLEAMAGASASTGERQPQA